MRNTPPILGVGIDVSKAKLDVCTRTADMEQFFVVPNDATGIRRLISKLRSCQCRIVLESTGRYHILCAFMLSQAELDVRVVNPIEAKRYLRSATRSGKTDRSDAAGLAHMAMLEENVPRFRSTKRDIHIRQKIGLLNSLERQEQSVRLTMRNYCEFQNVMRIPSSPLEKRLKHLANRLQHMRGMLEEEISVLIAEEEGAMAQVKLAQSVPGISPFVAHMLCQGLSMNCTSPKQWISFVGLDVSSRQSGQWKGRGRLSKRGNAYYRKRLSGAAWGAIMNNAAFRAYYDALRAEGRSYREALVIIARKILRVLYGVLKNGQPFSLELCRFG